MLTAHAKQKPAKRVQARLQDLDAPVKVGLADVDDAVKAPRARERGVQHVAPVGGRHDDHGRAPAEAVHLAQQLPARGHSAVTACFLSVQINVTS